MAMVMAIPGQQSRTNSMSTEAIFLVLRISTLVNLGGVFEARPHPIRDAVITP